MSEQIDDQRLKVFKNPDVADGIYKILESLDELKCCVHNMYGVVAATIGQEVMDSILISTTEPERYKLVCKDIDETLCKIVVSEKKDQDAQEKP